MSDFINFILTETGEEIHLLADKIVAVQHIDEVPGEAFLLLQGLAFRVNGYPTRVLDRIQEARDQSIPAPFPGAPKLPTQRVPR